MANVWTVRDFKRLLSSNGYAYARCAGDHMTYKNSKGRAITFNVRGKGLNKMVARRLIKEYGLSI